MALKRAAVIPAKGIGDALLMMIASHQLLQAGYEVTTFHGKIGELKTWFPGHHFSKEEPHSFGSYDLVIVENDNAPKIRKWIEDHNRGALFTLSIFYPTYSPQKHAPLSPCDYPFDKEQSMADNIAQAIAFLLRKEEVSKDNGIQIPQGLIHRRDSHRILIHPTSSEKSKNWSAGKYIKVAKHLKEQGYHPVFILNPQERKEWEGRRLELPLFETLDSLARTIYESFALIGNDSLIGHLASNLRIPTWIIADDPERMKLWKPGWLEGQIITPSKPKFYSRKLSRLRKRYWQHFISTRQVLSRFRG